jgi:hypothetical protein
MRAPAGYMTEDVSETPSKSKVFCCKGVGVVRSKLTEAAASLGCTRFLAIVDKLVTNVRKLGTGNFSKVRFVEAFRFAGVADKTWTTTEPDSQGSNQSSSSNNKGAKGDRLCPLRKPCIVLSYSL